MRDTKALQAKSLFNISSYRPSKYVPNINTNPTRILSCLAVSIQPLHSSTPSYNNKAGPPNSLSWVSQQNTQHRQKPHKKTQPPKKTAIPTKRLWGIMDKASGCPNHATFLPQLAEAGKQSKQFANNQEKAFYGLYRSNNRFLRTLS